MEKQSLSSKFPEIAKEWHPTKNGDLCPDNVTPKSGKKVWWFGKCGHEWQAVISHRTDGQGCPICSNHKLLSGFNDLATKYPNLATEWHPVKNGQLTPRDVFPMSNKKVWWLGKCGHEWQVAISCRTKGNNGCPICSGYIIEPGINDLQTINPELASEWDYKKNSGLSPANVSPNAHKKVWWICPQCGNQWSADIHHRNTGVGCPVCGRKTATDTRIENALLSGNSLSITNPLIASEWHPTKNGTIRPETVLPNSNVSVWWLCKKGHEWQALISSRNAGAGCPYCDVERKTSFPEQSVFFYISKYFEAISRHKLHGKELDIYMPSINTGIEYDGKYYHRTNVSKEKDLKKSLFFSEIEVRVIRIIESDNNSIDADIVSFKHDAQYTELPWVINSIGKMLGLNQPIDVDLNRDRLMIYEQYILLEKKNSLAVQFPNIAEQWHPTKNGKLTPQQVSFGSQKRVWWLGACGHEWQSVVSSRTSSNSGCPICSGNLIIAGINDLQTKNPVLAAEWDKEKNDGLSPSMISPFSHKKVWWKCSACGNVWKAIVKNRTYGGHCPVCSKNKRKKQK